MPGPVLLPAAQPGNSSLTMRPALSTESVAQCQLDLLKEVTVKVFDKGCGKNYVIRNVKVGDISSNFLFKQFLVSEFGEEMCGEAGHLDIGYFKGNKRVWMRTNDDYLKTLEKLRKGSTITMWCECGMKPRASEKRKVASDNELQHSEAVGDACSSIAKKRKSSHEDKMARVQEIFDKLKNKHGGKYTGPQYRLWAEAIDVNQHSSLDEPPQGSFFSNIQGRTHGVKKSDTSDVLTTAVSTLATSLAAALQPHSNDNTARPSTPPPHNHSSSSVITPIRAAELKTTYIAQIKELHSLAELGAITTHQYEEQRDCILKQMDRLNPK